MVLHTGTLQNGNVTKWYVLQNGTCYKTICVTKRYALQNGTRYKMVMLKNGNVTKWYVLQNGMLQNCTCYKTVHFSYCTMKAPTHGLVGHLP